MEEGRPQSKARLGAWSQLPQREHLARLPEQEQRAEQLFPDSRCWGPLLGGRTATLPLQIVALGRKAPEKSAQTYYTLNLLLFCSFSVVPVFLAWIKDDIRQKLNSGWKVFRWNIYLFSNDKESWSAAVNRCREVNTNLASISTQEEQIYIDTEARNKKHSYWIGLKKNPKKTHGLEWVSGVDVTKTYWDRSTNQPDAETGEDCILISEMCPLLSCWHDYPCFLRTEYVCKKSPDPKFMGAMP